MTLSAPMRAGLKISSSGLEFGWIWILDFGPNGVQIMVALNCPTLQIQLDLSWDEFETTGPRPS